MTAGGGEAGRGWLGRKLDPEMEVRERDRGGFFSRRR